jgi:hypothetical protein
MRKILVISILALAISIPSVLSADSHEEKPESYIYATYFYCKTATQEQADELIKKNNAPVYDAAVADGTIQGWGWLSHHTGGKWRRIQYHMSDSVAGLLKSQETLGKRMDEAMGGADDGFAKICGAHEDYIWKMESGSGMAEDRASASISVYHVCKISKEERADEIVEKVFAPIYNKAVADGKIKSWGWSSHIVGGKYRRLGTMTANEFSGICGSHSDYLWDIVHEGRG